MEKILFAGDLHLYHKTPASRLDNYSETILKKLDAILSIESDYYLFSGDIFHRYNIPKYYITKVMEVFEKHKEKQIYTIIGNHDIAHNDHRFLDDSPIGMLFATKFIKPLDILLTDNFEILGLNYGETYKFSKTDKTKVLVSHSFFGYGNENERLDEKYCLNFDLVLLGHDHKVYPEMRIGNTQIIRPGAVSRLTSGTDDIRNKISVVLINILKDKFSIHKVGSSIHDICREEKIISCNPDVFNLAYLETKKTSDNQIKNGFNFENSFGLIELDDIESVVQGIQYDEEIKEQFLDKYTELRTV